MPDFLTAASAPVLQINSVGERVLIAQGPLQGLSGVVAEVDGDEVLVDLRATISGLLLRCQATQIASV